MVVATPLSQSPTLIQALAGRIARGEHQISTAEARALLDVQPGTTAYDALFAGAQLIRDSHVGSTLKVCSVVNVKAGNCSEDCSYCAQSHDSTNTDYQRTKWTVAEDVQKAADSAAANGASAMSLVAAWWGVKEGSQLKMVTESIRQFSQNGKVRPDVNLGILESQHCADEIAKAGAKVYGHNLETSRSHFSNVCSTHSWDERMKTINYIKQAGMGLCSGGIFGMGESKDQRIEFLEQVRFIEPDMVPLNFLNPLKGTKLEGQPVMDADEALVTLATARFILPDRNLMAAGGKEVVLKDRLVELFKTGLNAVMVGNYLTTLGQDPEFWQRAAAQHGMRLVYESHDETATAAKPGCGSGCGS